ncbi:uncharacterized protein LOC102314601 isoform X4 [Haplochromis burtoni]|uniref:uncharacterized protein LOC102314601 isoform X4 n=1 Tax=Haplochromis burtoni TaxID=8153 RepID=UPI001C2D0F51|nr:uncharacterized protein LOC102314601 isoform X4 [Haplochromis burtoni]
MTSVNSPACVLARNHFYRSLPPSPEPTKPARGCQDKQRLPTLWVTVETAPGLPGLVGTKGLWVSIILSASSSSSTSKPSNHRAK